MEDCRAAITDTTTITTSLLRPPRGLPDGDLHPDDPRAPSPAPGHDANERILGVLGRAADRCFPDGSFPPAVIEAILQASGGFNPEAAFPKGSFPRAWPFVGGQLPPPAPPPPSRRLVINEVGEKWKIVWRGEIPTVHVPRRDPGLPNETTCSTHPVPIQETQLARSDPARDPP